MGRLSLIWPILKASIYQPGLATLWWRGHSVFRQTWTSITKTELAIGPIQRHWPNWPSNPIRTNQYGHSNRPIQPWPVRSRRPDSKTILGWPRYPSVARSHCPEDRSASSFALLCFTLLCFTLLYFALLYFALLCFTLLYFAWPNVDLTSLPQRGEATVFWQGRARARLATLSRVAVVVMVTL